MGCLSRNVQKPQTGAIVADLFQCDFHKHQGISVDVCKARGNGNKVSATHFIGCEIPNLFAVFHSLFPSSAVRLRGLAVLVGWELDNPTVCWTILPALIFPSWSLTMPPELYEHVFSVERRLRAATDMSLRCAVAPRAPLISSGTLVERNVRVMNFSCLFGWVFDLCLMKQMKFYF